jgi:hypothetical protein
MQEEPQGQEQEAGGEQVAAAGNGGDRLDEDRVGGEEDRAPPGRGAARPQQPRHDEKDENRDQDLENQVRQVVAERIESPQEVVETERQRHQRPIVAGDVDEFGAVHQRSAEDPADVRPGLDAAGLDQGQGVDAGEEGAEHAAVGGHRGQDGDEAEDDREKEPAAAEDFVHAAVRYRKKQG